MELIPQIAWLLFCLFFSFANYVVIEKLNERVRHGINGIFGFGISFYFAVFVDWKMGAVMLLIARTFFDSLLNYLRFRKELGLEAIGYVPRHPKSIIDKVEKWAFGMDGFTPKIIYLFLITMFNTVWKN